MNNSSCSLYLISPATIAPDFPTQLESVLKTGTIACFQLRLKDIPLADISKMAKTIVPICHAYGVQCLINDHAQIARDSGADGVHIGQNDGSAAEARKIVGKQAIVGVSCYDVPDRAIEAGEQGADYVAFGAFYPTATKLSPGAPKPEILEWWSTYTTLPCVAIGGITAENCAPLIEAGADFIAVVSAIWNHPKGPENGAKTLADAIKTAVAKRNTA